MNQNTLTNEQKSVVLHDLNTPAKVIAVAGAGKTTTLISRIEYLLSQGVDASQIGVFMFNKSAQEEFSERLSLYLSASGSQRTPNVMTFHGFGLRLCRRLENRGWLPQATLLTDDFSQVKLIREALTHLSRRGEETTSQDEKDWLEDALLFIDQVKASTESAKGVFDQLGWAKDKQFFIALYNEMETLRKRKKQRFFSDLLADPYECLLALNEEERGQIQTYVPNYRYLLVDEFQDINPCQYALLKLLYPIPCQWMIVGDVQQCIYEWRGASPKIMAHQFDQDFPSVTTYPLSSSFRFGHEIGLMASSVISENKAASLVIGAGAPTDVSFSNETKTGKALLTELKSWLMAGGKLEESAVLVRLYGDMVPVQLALMHKNVPYQLHGDSPLLENRQIRMLMAYLAVMAGGLERPECFFKQDDIEYLLTVPSLGGSVNQRKSIIQEAKRAPHLLPQIIESLADNSEGWRAKKLYERADWLRSLSVYRNTPAQGLSYIIEKLGIYRYFESTSSKEIQAQEKIATCDAFLAYIKGVGKEADVLLSQLKSLNEKNMDQAHGVHLMTIHKAKGLEFKQVLLCGLQEGRFPYYDEDLSAIDQRCASELASERRLFYVAITRAKQKLVFLETVTGEERKQMALGNIPRSVLKNQSISRFVFEAQPLVVKRICELWHNSPSGTFLDTEKASLFQRYLTEVPASPDIVFRHHAGFVKESLKSGDKVRHDQYGQGVVIRQEQSGNRMIFVDFGEQGLKRFNPKHTQLVKLSVRQ